MHTQTGSLAPAEAHPFENKEVAAAAPALLARSRAGSTLLWMQAVVLIAVAQVLFAGYRLGVGNQTIQIPFLKTFQDPQLFTRDAAIGTRDTYPSYFFRGLAWLAGSADIPTVYLILHLVTTAAVMLAAYWLSRAIFRDHLAALVMLLLVFAGHHRALAGDEMYSLGFTHTWAVFPLAILAMALLYREHLVAAFALAGVIFNLHALTSAYLAFMFGFWAIFQVRELGWKRLVILAAVFLAFASPTLAEMAIIQHKFHPRFDSAWIAYTRVRSADHSFPSSWWQPGTSDIPRFLLLAGLATLSLSFPAPPRQQRKSLLIGAAIGILFLAGTVFADVIPLPIVLRAQLFRSSRLLMVLMFVHIAYSIAMGWRADDQNLVSRLLEAVSATATLVTVAVPPLISYLPYAFALALVVALLNGRLSWIQAAFCSIVCAVVLLAAQRLKFPLPFSAPALALAALIGFVTLGAWAITQLRIGVGLSACLAVVCVLLPALLLLALFPLPCSAAWLRHTIGGLFSFLPQSRGAAASSNMLLILAAACALGLWLAARLELGRILRVLLVLAGFGVCVLLPLQAAHQILYSSASRLDPWVDIQLWARDHTPKQALFLTPPEQSGFRIYSDRSTVCEWRDGTQMYFSAKFGAEWWKTISELRPGMMYNPEHTRQLSPGKSLKDLSDKELSELAANLRADYIVLPNGTKRKLRAVYQDAGYTVYTPQVLSIFDARDVKMLPGVQDKDVWIEQERFIQETAQANIERYRKDDVRIQIVDANGQPLSDANYTVTQTRQAFHFGASLPFFAKVDGECYNEEYKPKPVDPRELERFKEVFNFTVIPFSGKWAYLEPVEGKYNFDELDKYVDWCVKNNIEMEFHYLSGLYPSWLYSKIRQSDSSQIQQLFLEHERKVVDRYADRIKFWQVINDKYLDSYAPAVFRDIRARHPELKLGMSDCTKFYALSGNPEADIYRGSDDLDDLQRAGAPVDFFAFHGHAPYFLWPDWKQVYDTFNHFAKQGVKVEVSEAEISSGGSESGRSGWFGGRGERGGSGRIVGPIINGRWTPEMQAEVLVRFFTVCFSHPDCQGFNYWNLGPDSSFANVSLLDENYNPKPAFLALKHLIRDEWMTHLPPGQTPSDGAIAFRGFHGDYEIAVTLPDGKTCKGKFSIIRDTGNNYRLKVDPARGTLVAE